MTPEIIAIIQNETGAPWWNGESYAEYKGYPQKLKAYATACQWAVDDLEQVMEWLREEKQFDKADRLRTIIGRLAREVPEKAGDPADLVISHARGWK